MRPGLFSGKLLAVEIDVLRCPVCREGLAMRPTATCATCETAVHEDCREFIGGCARFACPGAAGTRRRLVEYLRASSRAEMARYAVASTVLAAFLVAAGLGGMSGLPIAIIGTMFAGFVVPVLMNHRDLLLETRDRIPADRELIHRLQHDSVFRDLDAAARRGAQAGVALLVLACLGFAALHQFIAATACAVSSLVIWVWCLWWPDFARRRPDRLMSYWKDEIQRVLEAEGPLQLEGGRAKPADSTTPRA